MFIEPNPFDKDLTIKKDKNAIKESIRNCILTTQGERPFEPTFGTKIYSSVFENIDDLTFFADGDISLSVLQNDPRVELGPRNYSLSDKTISISFDYFIRELNIRETIKIGLERTR